MQPVPLYSKTIWALPIVPFIFSACLFDGDGSKKIMPRIGARSLFVVTSDFTSGALLSYSLDSLLRGPDSLKINQDSKVVSVAGSVFVLEGYKADNILRYDPKKQQIVFQEHLGGGSNPSDLVALNNDIGFLALQDSAKVLEINLNTGKTIRTLDLSAYTYTPPMDSGSKASSPHAISEALRGDTLFVALQRRNGNWKFPGGLSIVLIVDTKTFTIKDTLIASGKNAGEMWLNGNNLYLSCPGEIGKNDGSLFRWDLTTRKITTVLTEATLGSDFGGMSCASNGNCIVQSYISFGNEPVRRFDLASGTLGELLPGIVDAFGGIAIDMKSNTFFVGDRNPTGSGIFHFSENGTKILGPISTGLPPSSLTIAEY